MVKVAVVWIGPLRELGEHAVRLCPVLLVGEPLAQRVVACQVVLWQRHALLVVAHPLRTDHTHARGDAIHLQRVEAVAELASKHLDKDDGKDKDEGDEDREELTHAWQRGAERGDHHLHILGARNKAKRTEGAKRSEGGDFLDAGCSERDDGDEDHRKVEPIPAGGEVGGARGANRDVGEGGRAPDLEVQEAKSDRLEQRLEDEDGRQRDVDASDGALEPVVLVPPGPVDPEQDGREDD
mmetsp:Transcript_13668/g.40080  ORF Transcript_13668/g.40080 Transcript_13668/m.40080 type:complete len:239 (+) Transcript_13668:2248-2964(+)